MKTIYLITRNWCSNEYKYTTPYAAVPLTADYIQRLLSYRAVFHAAHSAVPSVSEVRIWDGAPNWLSGVPDVDGLNDVWGEAADVGLDRNGQTIVENTSDWLWPETSRTCVEEVIVTGAGAEWTCSGKHDNDTHKTGEVGWKTLEEILSYLQSSSVEEVSP